MKWQQLLCDVFVRCGLISSCNAARYTDIVSRARRELVLSIQIRRPADMTSVELGSTSFEMFQPRLTNPLSSYLYRHQLRRQQLEISDNLTSGFDLKELPSTSTLRLFLSTGPHRSIPRSDTHGRSVTVIIYNSLLWSLC